MQMNHYKGRARSRRLRSHFSSARAAQSFLYSPFLISRWHWGENNETAAAEVWWRPWGGSRQTTAFQLVRGEIYTGMAASPGRAGWGGGRGRWIRMRCGSELCVGSPSHTAHLCELPEAGREKTHSGGSGLGKFLQLCLWSAWPPEPCLSTRLLKIKCLIIYFETGYCYLTICISFLSASSPTLVLILMKLDFVCSILEINIKM